MELNKIKTIFISGETGSLGQAFLKDILCGNKVGCKTVFINRNYKETKPLNQITSVKNLKEATNCIIRNLEK